MEARELRIGNWVIDADDNNRVIQIKDGDDIDFAKDYTSIPLTEEWLVKFGFIDNNSYFNLPDFQEFKISWSVRNVKTQEKSSFFLGDNFPEMFQINIAHIHSLQNLFFSLTGEELQLKANA